MSSFASSTAVSSFLVSGPCSRGPEAPGIAAPSSDYQFTIRRETTLSATGSADPTILLIRRLLRSKRSRRSRQNINFLLQRRNIIPTLTILTRPSRTRRHNLLPPPTQPASYPRTPQTIPHCQPNLSGPRCGSLISFCWPSRLAGPGGIRLGGRGGEGARSETKQGRAESHDVSLISRHASRCARALSLNVCRFGCGFVASFISVSVHFGSGDCS